MLNPLLRMTGKRKKWPTSVSLSLLHVVSEIVSGEELLHLPPRQMKFDGMTHLPQRPQGPSAGWQASGGRATIPLSFFKDAFVFRNLLSFNLTVTLSTSYGYGESHSLGYVKVQENVSPTAVNQALGSHVEIIQTSFFFHTHPRLKPCLIFHDSCLIIHPIIWAILAVWHVQVVHSLPPAAVDMHWSRKWEGYMAEIFYVVV